MAATAMCVPVRRRRALPAAALGLLGLVLVGQGTWIHAKALVAQVLLERAFAATIANRAAVKPWPWADTWPVARVRLPRLSAGAVVLHGSSGQALAFGPGHVATTPAAGEEGTAVYAAHRDTHFAFLRDVRIGDDILVTRADGAHLRFRVDRTAVVRWDVSGIDAQADGRRLVLATCWPFEARTPGPERYVVHGTMVE